MATIPLGRFLWERIHQVGVDTVMGVPGDFQLQILDYIYEVEGMKFVGNTNELNAAYAADGYARVKGGPGCVVTTHGVGELSAINGIAGAASERIPVIHVVGQTSRMLQEKHVMIHHSIGMKPDHQLYNQVSKPIRLDAAELWDGDKAPAEIDRVIRECILHSWPVYIFMPLDLHPHRVPATLLDKKIDLSLPVDSESEKSAIAAITDAFSKAKNPSIFIDMLVNRFAVKETEKLIDAVKVPFYAAHISKGVIDEDNERFVGLYNGSVSSPGIAQAIEASDMCLCLGWFPADTNGGLARNIPETQRVDVMDTYVVVQGNRYDNVWMAPLLSKLVDALAKLSLPPVEMPKLPKHDLPLDPEKITHNYIWPRLGQALKPGDVVVCDTGSPQYGIPDAPFPKDVHFMSQMYYGSIGWGCPAALGADMAVRERSPSKGRTVLVIGDGGFMLTIQEVAAMINEGLKPILLICNNYGYTIERAIHGARQKYNDIPPFKYAHMLSFFGGESKPGQNYHLCKTRAELDAALTSPHVIEPKEVQVLEVVMDTFDIPWKLTGLLKVRGGEAMKKYLTEEGFSNV